MPREELPPDPDALERWQQLPQHKPSKQALPPAAGGLRWTWWLLALLAALVVLALVFQSRIG